MAFLDKGEGIDQVVGEHLDLVIKQLYVTVEYRVLPHPHSRFVPEYHPSSCYKVHQLSARDKFSTTTLRLRISSLLIFSICCN